MSRSEPIVLLKILLDSSLSIMVLSGSAITVKFPIEFHFQSTVTSTSSFTPIVSIIAESKAYSYLSISNLLNGLSLACAEIKIWFPCTHGVQTSSISELYIMAILS